MKDKVYIRLFSYTGQDYEVMSFVITEEVEKRVKIKYILDTDSSGNIFGDCDSILLEDLDSDDCSYFKLSEYLELTKNG